MDSKKLPENGSAFSPFQKYLLAWHKGLSEALKILHHQLSLTFISVIIHTWQTSAPWKVFTMDQYWFYIMGIFLKLQEATYSV